ncbi:MAG TPA: AsmA-like C-terminal region-containing protein, partial [Nitrospiraceae bacterium]|nr:AsmA-like C-terminal region-containing protein [Nitrospiraceae bacterium]
FGTNVTASVIDRSRIIVEVWEVRALDGTKLLAQARLAGSSGVTGATDLRLNMIAEEPTELIARLGLLTNRQQVVVSGGHVTGEVQVTTTESSKPLTILADLRLTNLTLRLEKRRSLIRTVNLQADLMVDAARTVIDVRRMELAGESVGAGTGTMTASGRWPMNEEQGAMTLMIKEWDAEPFLEFFGFLPGRVPGPLPVNAEMTVTQEAKTKTMTLRGKESIGPMRVTVNGQPDEPATLHLQHEVMRRDEEIRVAAMTLSVDRITRLADRVSLRGSVKTGAQPRLQLQGAVNALDADWYAALLGPASTRSSPGDAQPASAAGPPLPLDLDVDVAIGTVKYRTLQIGAGRLVAKGDGRRMQATLEPTGLAGGTVQGTMTVVVKHQRPEFAWDLKGSALALGTLTKAWFGDPEPQIIGQGQFATAGTGQGQDEMLRQSLNGTLVFDVTDGQFFKVPLLEFLADQTRIDQFRDLGFQTLHGELDVKDGWAHLKQVRVNGPVAGIEAGGKLALDGRLDVRVEPKIGPTLSQHVKIPCLDKLAKTTEGFTVLPLAVTVKGTTQAPSYGVDLTPGSMVERQAGALVGTIADLLTACRGGDAAQKITENAMGAVKDTVKDLMKNLFDRKEKP